MSTKTEKPVEQQSISNAELNLGGGTRSMASRDRKAKLKEEMKKQQIEDSRMVRGFFRFFEVPGGTLRFAFRKHRDEQVKHYEMEDGKMYTVPLGVAKHLNNDCWYPVNKFRKDESGSRHYYVGKRVQRTAFQSTDYIDTSAEKDFIVEPVRIVP
jgi:hypothetical protein